MPSVDTRPVVELSAPQAQPPAQLTALCSTPVALPATAMSAGAVERAWGQDRVSLVECGERHTDLVQFYRMRDRGLAGR